MLQSDEYDEAKARELATLKKTGPAKRLALSVRAAHERPLMQSLTLVSRGRGIWVVIGPSSPKKQGMSCMAS